MAEVIATELIKVVFQKLASEALNPIVGIKSIHSELDNLKKTLTKIQKLLVDASEKENGDKDVKKWLDSLQHMAYDIEDVLDGLATDMHREQAKESEATTSKVRKFIPTFCTNVSLSKKLGHALDTIAIKLRDLEKERLLLGLTEKDEKPTHKGRRYETSLLDESMIVGRQGEKEKLLHKLCEDYEACDQNFSVVPIVGMGGVGKTTLARVLYNAKQVNEHFELKAWVCVSHDFDVLKITKTIFEDLVRELKEFGDLNQLQVALRENLREKRFLLVLDDVWSENSDDWENLVRPFHSCARGSKIIMTTRKEQLLKSLAFDHLDYLTSLSHDDAMSLFAYHALGVYNFDSHPTLKPLGEGIVNKCGGLPLALKTLGRLLGTRTDVKDWDDVLNSEIWGLRDNNILPALRLSYDDLPACLKQLFAYCSLFPKDFMFDKDDLVRLWMAEGFLNQSIANKSAERLGHEYFEMLLSRSFFQLAPNEESLYVMPVLMNDLAIFVSGDYFVRFDSEIEIEKEDPVKYRHMSFIMKELVSYQKFDTLKRAKSLRTFLALSVGVTDQWDLFYLSNKILVDLLPKLPLLRVLCLSCFRINELPEFIGTLKQLRYLNLSQTGITELPENVCNLYNLQTLIVFGCRNLSKLPNSFLKLKNLRHFDIRDTPLSEKKPEGVGELYNLKTLTKIIIRGDDGFAITDLKKLNLHGKASIEGLDKVKNATSVRDINFSKYRFTELELKSSDVFDGSQDAKLEKEVLSELKPHSDNLKRLTIMFYGGAEFPNWVGDPSFLQLVHVSIKGCRKCVSLPSLAQLPSLKELFIEDMDEVKVVGLELLGTTSVEFPSLEILRFRNMKGWEVWSTNSVVVFPCLRELCMISCPNLVEVSLESLPSLRFLEISGCGDGVLRSIVRAAPSVTELKINSISGLTDEAWKGVLMYIGVVEDLIVENCDEIRYWSIYLTYLRILRVNNCESMKHCICRNSIESLSIQDCPSLESFSDRELLTFTSLKTMVIRNCPSMDASFPCGNWPPGLCNLEIGGVNKPFSDWGPQKFPTSLVKLQLYGGDDCNISQLFGLLPPYLTSLEINGFNNLKSVSMGLKHLTFLQHLSFKYCRNIIDLPETLLPSLLSLEIRWCPNLRKRIRGRRSHYWPLISRIAEINID